VANKTRRNPLLAVVTNPHRVYAVRGPATIDWGGDVRDLAPVYQSESLSSIEAWARRQELSWKPDRKMLFKGYWVDRSTGEAYFPDLVAGPEKVASTGYRVNPGASYHSARLREEKGLRDADLGRAGEAERSGAYAAAEDYRRAAGVHDYSATREFDAMMQSTEESVAKKIGLTREQMMGMSANPSERPCFETGVHSWRFETLSGSPIGTFTGTYEEMQREVRERLDRHKIFSAIRIFTARGDWVGSMQRNPGIDPVAGAHRASSRRPFSYSSAMANAQANVDHFKVPFVVFADTSGNWRSERLSGFSEGAQVAKEGNVVYPRTKQENPGFSPKDMTPLQAEMAYEKLYNDTRRRMGGAFDWPTLKASIPGRAEMLRDLWKRAYGEKHKAFRENPYSETEIENIVVPDGSSQQKRLMESGWKRISVTPAGEAVMRKNPGRDPYGRAVERVTGHRVPEYRTVDLRSERGIQEAESLKAEGWKQGSVGTHTIQFYRNPPRSGMSTPWGRAQDVSRLADGIWLVGTASHGGIKLSRERNAKIANFWRSPGGWYEEDIEWAIPVLTFPQEFPENQSQAHDTMRRWMPYEYGRFTGREVLPSESHVVAEREHKRLHAGDYLGLAAWGDWDPTVPKGMVGVFAGRGGRTPSGAYPPDTAYFLVPQAEYDARGKLDFVIDPARHQQWSGPSRSNPGRNPGASWHLKELRDAERGVEEAYPDQKKYWEGVAGAHRDSYNKSARKGPYRRNPSVTAEERTQLLKIKGVQPWMLEDAKFLQAVNKYIEFHGCWPTSISKRDIKGMGAPQDKEFLVNMGKALDVSYEPTPAQKGSNKYGSSWLHEFNEKGNPKDKSALPDRLCTADGKTIITHGGKFAVKDWVRK